MNSPTGGNPRVFESGFIKLDVTRYGKVYDTMQGVGIQGRVSPTVEKKGRSPWWLAIPVLLVLVLVFCGPKWAMGMGSGLLHHFVGGAISKFQPGSMVHVPVATNAPGAVPAQTNLPPVRSVAPAVASAQASTVEPVYMSGHIKMDGVMSVYLSDGRKYQLGDGECTEVTSHFCVVNERVYRSALPTHASVADRWTEHASTEMASGDLVRQRTLRVHFPDGANFDKPLPEPREFTWQGSGDGQGQGSVPGAVLGERETGTMAGNGKTTWVR